MSDKVAWLNSHFRVWIVPLGKDIPEYEWSVCCEKLDQNGPVLYGLMPEAKWMLRATFNRIDLVSNACGDPSKYDPASVRFKCHAPIAADWRIEPLGTFHSGGRAAVMFYVHFHCSDVEWVNVE